jgi:hypothetical protein
VHTAGSKKFIFFNKKDLEGKKSPENRCIGACFFAFDVMRRQGIAVVVSMDHTWVNGAP